MQLFSALGVQCKVRYWIKLCMRGLNHEGTMCGNSSLLCEKSVEVFKNVSIVLRLFCASVRKMTNCCAGKLSGTEIGHASQTTYRAFSDGRTFWSDWDGRFFVY